MPQDPTVPRSEWTQLQDDYGLRSPVTFKSESNSSFMTAGESFPPALPTISKSRKNWIAVGLAFAPFDLCIIPISLFYGLTYNTNLSQEDVFLVIACVFCMGTFAHYTHRCVRLVLKMSKRFGPVGWQRMWRLLEFTNVTFAIGASLFEVVLLIGTVPSKPWIKVCAMVPSTMCYYMGAVFLATAFLTHWKYCLPFPMSSTRKGALWRPALFAHLEDTGAIEGRGEVAYREALMRRYESSPVFRSMLLTLTFVWGFTLLGIAIVTTIVILALHENIAFGFGWGLPFALSSVPAVWTSFFVRRSLADESRPWEGAPRK